MRWQPLYANCHVRAVWVYPVNYQDMVLVVADDGVGLPESDEQLDSLGLTIVRTLVEGDLKGEFTMERAEPGTHASVTFNKEVSNRI